MSLAVIVPSKGRPQNVDRLLTAMEDTCGYELTQAFILVDPTEPLYDEYDEVVGKYRWVSLMRVNTMPQRIGPMINRVAYDIRLASNHIGFLGDDHLPRTSRWDEKLCDALEGKPGVAYGNDLLQGENIPTAAILSSRIVQVLGYFVPRSLEHLYLDDYWKMLGLALGNLQYRADVVIEHLHPTCGKAQYDQTYTEANASEQYTRDGGNFERYKKYEWGSELRKLKEGLGIG